MLMLVYFLRLLPAMQLVESPIDANDVFIIFVETFTRRGKGTGLKDVGGVFLREAIVCMPEFVNQYSTIG